MAGAYGFGIVRSLDPIKSRARLAELCELLTRDTKAVFLPHHADSYGQLVRDFGDGKIAVAWMPPLACIELDRRNVGAALVLPVRSGSMTYFSALVAKRGQGPRSVSEVKRAKVGWVDPESSSGYLVPRLYLQSLGRSLPWMFGEEVMLGSHAAVLDAIESGRVDVGATYCATKAPRWQNAQGAERPIDALAVAGPIPNDAIVVSSGVPEETRFDVMRWFLALDVPRARELTGELLGAVQFRTASFGHFAPLRRMVAAARHDGT
jgi:phosphonate transport system substrate-binding protein